MHAPHWPRFPWLAIAVALVATLPARAEPPLLNQQFVSALYQDLLARPIDATGQQFANDLTLGAKTRQQVADLLLTSTEHRTRQVRDFYNQFLGRDPSAGDTAALIPLLSTSYDSVRTTILGSAEYFITQSGETNAGFVQSLYGDLLGRTPSAPELSGFVNALNAGQTRGAVANQVLNSTEGHTVLLDHYYRQYLDRAPDPTGSGFFIPLLNSGANDPAVIVPILASEEYFANAVPEPTVAMAAAAVLLLGRRRTRASWLA